MPPPWTRDARCAHHWSAVRSTVNGGTADTPYDARGHNTVNEITTIDPNGAVGSFNVTHDSAGNLNILPDRTDLTKAERYTYDYRNRLIKAEHSANYDQQTPTWTTTVDYLVDGLNRRVKKDLPGAGVDVIFVYDGWRCIEERELDGETWEARRQFVFGALYLDEVLLFDKDTDADGDCTEGEGAGSTRYLYAANDNFNVMALTDATGVVKERYKYDPYGACTVTLDDSSGNPFRFQGQRYCPETGLYYFKNRDHSPTLGRFLQRDPAGYRDALDAYQMLFGNPMSALDPYGLWSLRNWFKFGDGSYEPVDATGTDDAWRRGWVEGYGNLGGGRSLGQAAYTGKLKASDEETDAAVNSMAESVNAIGGTDTQVEAGLVYWCAPRKLIQAL